MVITIFSDRSFTFITKTPPVPVLIKRAVAIAKGSAEPHKTKVGKITAAQVEEIAKIKMPDLNCFDVEAAIRSVKGIGAVNGRRRYITAPSNCACLCEHAFGVPCLLRNQRRDAVCLTEVCFPTCSPRPRSRFPHASAALS